MSRLSRPVGLRRLRLTGNLPWCCLESSSTRGCILKMSLEKLHYDFYLASLLDLEALQTKCRFTTRRDTLYVVRHAAIAFFQYISHCTDSNLCDNLWHMAHTTWLINNEQKQRTCVPIVANSGRWQARRAWSWKFWDILGVGESGSKVPFFCINFHQAQKRKESRSGRKRRGPLHLR